MALEIKKSAINVQAACACLLPAQHDRYSMTDLRIRSFSPFRQEPSVAGASIFYWSTVTNGPGLGVGNPSPTRSSVRAWGVAAEGHRHELPVFDRLA